jgi:hypothetical protein
VNKVDYDNIASCIRRRGTITQRRALLKLRQTQGWDETHGSVLELALLGKKISKLEEEKAWLENEVYHLNKKLKSYENEQV